VKKGAKKSAIIQAALKQVDAQHARAEVLIIAPLSNEDLRAPEIGEGVRRPTQVAAGIIAWQKHRESWKR
jgi:hypothetical protein